MDKYKEYKEVERLIYPHYKWNTIGNKSVPYCFEICKKEQNLYYFGANHSRDINNKQYPKLRNYWQNFLEKTGGENSIVLIESGIRPVRENETEAVRKDSEAGFITLLANQAGIPVDCPEPDTKTERRELLKKEFSYEEIEYYYFARTIDQWSRRLRDPKPDFEEHISRFLGREEQTSGWDNFNFSLKHLMTIHKNIFGFYFDRSDQRFFYNITNPTENYSRINEVARASSVIRNIYIVLGIKKYWDEEKNIFAVFGFAHPILQEPALRKLLT